MPRCTIGNFPAGSAAQFSGRQCGQTSRAQDVCNRSFPDPLRIVLWYSKLEFDEEKPGIEQHCHSEPVRTLVWESPSNSRQSIVIHTALLHHFHSLLTKSGASNRGIATPVCELARNDREFDKFQFVYLLTKTDMHIILQSPRSGTASYISYLITFNCPLTRAAGTGA